MCPDYWVTEHVIVLDTQHRRKGMIQTNTAMLYPLQGRGARIICQMFSEWQGGGGLV